VSEHTLLRIGELSRRSGVSPDLLRAWERRYGVLRPVRSPGGLRLYSLDDLDRVRRMQERVAAGMATAEAAAHVVHAPVAPQELSALQPADAQAALAAALDAFDEPAAQAVVDAFLAAATVDALLSELVLPYLRTLGERWERGEVSIAQEHFASAVVRGRLLGLARGWGRGLGPLALLACAPGEQHDLGLLAFGVALRGRGWRIASLGADTPLDTLADAARALEPELVVVTAIRDDRLRPLIGELRALAERHRLALAGPGAEGLAAAAGGALELTGDPVAEADRVTAVVSAARVG
jgi:MerR family transcriptional regulator, light-induced transcriptional regulator